MRSLLTRLPHFLRSAPPPPPGGGEVEGGSRERIDLCAGTSFPLPTTGSGSWGRGNECIAAHGVTRNFSMATGNKAAYDGRGGVAELPINQVSHGSIQVRHGSAPNIRRH